MQELSASLLLVVDKLRTRGIASQEFIRLTRRARQIATQARTVSTSKWGVVENAAALAKELGKFAIEVEVASERAASETSGNAAIATALAAQAQRLREIGVRGSAAQPRSIREELEPLEATLQTLRDRMRNGDSVAKDATLLARRAAVLAESSAKLSGGGRGLETAALEIQRSLCTFVEEAVSISERMSDTSTGLSDVAASIARGTTEVLGGGVSSALPSRAAAIVWGQ